MENLKNLYAQPCTWNKVGGIAGGKEGTVWKVAKGEKLGQL